MGSPLSRIAATIAATISNTPISRCFSWHSVGEYKAKVNISIYLGSLASSLT